MTSPLTTLPKSTLVLSPAYYGSISRYAHIARYGKSVVDITGKFDKRLKSTHRMEIADVNGRLQLTLPIVKPESLTRAKWNDIKLSTHGEWWHVQRVALESAYGRTPYFEFYIDRFLPFLSRDTIDRFPTLARLTEAIEREICDIIGVEAPAYSDINAVSHDNTDDMRDKKLIPMYIPEYYQVRKSSQGFISDLSILDLIFNMGPETPFILARCDKRI